MIIEMLKSTEAGVDEGTGRAESHDHVYKTPAI
jgi:hypothetical protein